MKALLALALALSASPAFANDSAYLDIQGVRCNISNAAGVGQIETSRTKGQITTAYGDVPVTRITGVSTMGIVQLQVTYTSRVFLGQDVTVFLYLWAPSFQSGQTLYGTMFGQATMMFLTPPGPFSGGGSYMDPLHGFVPQNLPVDFYPLALANCQIATR